MARNFMGKCLCGSLTVGMCLTGCVILLIIASPIALITVGAVYLHECPVAPAIPRYVIAFGIWLVLMMGLFALPKLYPAASDHKLWAKALYTLCVLFFAGLIYGNYQVYSIYQPNYDKNIAISNTSTHDINAPTTPEAKLNLNLDKGSLLPINQTGMISNNQTLWKLIQTLAHSSSGDRNTERTTAVLYCNWVVYMFAFYTTTLVYILIGNILLSIFCSSSTVYCPM
ncbi:uncharacterized protein KZ484_014655 isoform 1-T2 [Pholidichthys leucotaenia]